MKALKYFVRALLVVALLIGAAKGCDRALKVDSYKQCKQIPKEINHDDCSKILKG